MIWKHQTSGRDLDVTPEQAARHTDYKKDCSKTCPICEETRRVFHPQSPESKAAQPWRDAGCPPVQGDEA